MASLKLGSPPRGPLLAEQFLSLALRISAEVAALHLREPLHGGLSTEGISIEGGGRVILTPPGPSPKISPLAYLAPEQTGRTNRVVDGRADLYALGVIFYELLTGRLPFRASDPLGWVHAHLARTPPPPVRIRPGSPPQLSNIVMRLLAKVPEERYQTASGLHADLLRCQRSLAESGEMERFPLGQQDHPRDLLLSQRVYGREHEFSELEAAWTRVAVQGGVELVRVMAEPGSGKSVLVQEWARSLTAREGIFVMGKFEPLQRERPYTTIAEALTELVRHVLGESDQRLRRWRDAIITALGPNAQVVAEGVPELRLVVGEQPAPPELPAIQARDRFQWVIGQFLRLFAREGSPLVVFLDDVQWADAASLELLAYLLDGHAVDHLLVILAGRPVEPSGRGLGALSIPTTNLELGPLSISALTELLAATLHPASEELLPLAAAVAGKTASNPLFVGQFLKAIQRERLIWFDSSSPGWRWDLDRIRGREVAPNVGELIARRIRALDRNLRRVLVAGAGLGSRFQAEILAEVLEMPLAEVCSELRSAVREGFLMALPVNSSSQPTGLDPGRIAYRWSHDRIEQEFRSLIPAPDLPQLHLAIGRAILRRSPAQEVDERLFEIVNHLAAGVALIHTDQERRQFARLAMLAGLRAKETGAYSAARGYFELVPGVLSPEMRAGDHELAFTCALQRAECAALTADRASAGDLFEEALAAAGSVAERAHVLSVRAQWAQAVGDFPHAIEHSLEGLKLLGIDLPRDPAECARQAGVVQDRLRHSLEQVEDEVLVQTPAPASNGGTVAELLLAIRTAALYEPEFSRLTDFHLVEQWRSPGLTAVSFAVYAHQQMVQGNHKVASRFVRLVLRLLDRGEIVPHTPIVCLKLDSTLDFWFHPLDHTIWVLRKGYEAALQTGDINHSHYCRVKLCLALCNRGERLEQVAKETAAAAVAAERAGIPVATANLQLHLAVVRDLMGPGPWFLPSADPNPTPAVKALVDQMASGQVGVASNEYYVGRLRNHCIFGEYEIALEWGRRFDPRTWNSRATYTATEHCFYQALALAATMTSNGSQESMELLEANREWLRGWAERCPANFEHRHLLVLAELARLTGPPNRALQLYVRAISSARRYGFVQVEAVASEQAARHCDQSGLKAEGMAHLQAAHEAYQRWGAARKVRQLEEAHPQLAPGRGSWGLGGTGADLDLLSVVKASQAISGEIERDRLAARLLEIMIEQAGAERGWLVLLEDGAKMVALEAQAGGDRVMIRRARRRTPRRQPGSILNYVRRTGEQVVLEDAREPNQFSADQYLVRNRPRSVICLPIRRGQQPASAILYLEHSQLGSVFTTARLEVLGHLAAQAAVSLENAGLYGELQDAEERFRIAFEAAPIGMAILGSDRRVERANRRLCDMLGFAESELRGVLFRDLVEVDPRDADHALERLLRGEMPAYHVERPVRHRGGRLLWAQISLAVIQYRRAAAPSFLIQVQDISERRQLVNALEHQALHDALTGLPNRTLLMDRLRLALSRSTRRPGSVAVVFMDLDRFKVVNDSLGHTAGDQLLIAVARRLEGLLRAGDTAARFGGDEFVLLYDEVSSEEEVASIAERVNDALEEAFRLDGQEIYVTVSMGIALARGADEDPNVVIAQADSSMYRAKSAANTSFAIFDKEQASEAVERLQLENDLRRARERGELELYYQPVVDLRTGRIRSVEALLRWRRPHHELVSPEDFIGVAEESGLVVAIGDWVLEAACRQAVDWQRRLRQRAPTVWVNLSARQLRPDLARRVESILAHTEASPSQIRFEVTETVLMADAQTAQVPLAAFRKLGIGLGIDDFGTGYSSLAYLKDFRVQMVKIDRSFIGGLGRKTVDSALVGAMITMAHALRIEVVAEGVETAQALRRLRSLDCDLAQGYLLGRPGPVGVVEEQILAGRPPGSRSELRR